MLSKIDGQHLRKCLKVFDLVPDRPASKTWLPSLDGLRAIAVILVFLEHVTGNVLESSSSDRTLTTFFNFGHAGMGRSGVYLFFVLSSFLLTSQLLRPSVKFRSFSLWINYGFKRFIRIYPLYLFVLLVYVVFPSFKYSFHDLAAHLALQAAGNHFWTIPVEVKYYFILPGIAWLISKLTQRSLLLAVLTMFSLMLISELIEATIWTSARLSVLPHLSIFLIGSLAALIHSQLLDQAEQPGRVKTAMEVLSILAVLGIAISLQTQPVHLAWLWLFGSEMPMIAGNHWLYQLHGLLWAVLLVCHLHGRGWISHALSWKPLRYIGVVSFGIYLWHIAVLGYLDAHLALPGFAKVAAIAIVTVAVATVTYITIEKPTLRLRLLRPPSASLAYK